MPRDRHMSPHIRSGHRSRLVRFVSLAALLTLLFGNLPADAQGQPVDQVAIVVPASRTNQGWDQQGADNLERVGEVRDINVEVAENAGYDDITPILQDLADGGSDLIVCHASNYQTVCPEFAEASGVPIVVIENPGAVSPGLVSDIETQAQEAAYLAGVVAGKETRTGTVAVVVSGEPPTWNYMTVGFAEGLHSVRPDARLLYQVIGESAYDDAPNAKRVTESVLAANADIVFGMGDGASFGMIQAIREHNEGLAEDKQARFIDVIGDKSGTDAGEYLLTSVLFNYEHAYTHMIDGVENGTFGDVYTMNLENDGVRLLDFPLPVSDETIKTVEDARKAIIDGKVKVSATGDAGGVERRLDELFPT